MLKTRRLALIGASEGPWVPIDRLLKPTLRIRGLQSSHEISLLYHGLTVPLLFTEDGDYPIEQRGFVKLSCSAPDGHGAICEIYSERAA